MTENIVILSLTKNAPFTRTRKRIKGWSRKKKEALINGDFEELKRLSNIKK